MKTVLLISFILSATSALHCKEADTSSVPAQSSRGKIHISELISRIESIHKVMVCTEDICAPGQGTNQADCYVSTSNLNLHDLGAVLAKLEAYKIVSSTNDGLVTFRASELRHLKDNPLTRALPAFRLKGTLADLLHYILARNRDQVFARVSCLGSYDETLPITMRFDSNVSIEEILFSLTREYGIRWRVVLDPFPINKASPTIIWSFHRPRNTAPGT